MAYGNLAIPKELQTLVVEMEAILNDRPITYLSSDVRDELLTPSHLLIGKKNTPLYHIFTLNMSLLIPTMLKRLTMGSK